MKLFVAGSSQHKDEIHAIINLLKGCGHKIYDWTQHPAWSDESLYDPLKIGAEDLIEVKRASDGLIWVLHRTTSEGATAEAFEARGLRYPVCCYIAESGAGEKFYSHQFARFDILSNCLNYLERLKDLREQDIKRDGVCFEDYSDNEIDFFEEPHWNKRANLKHGFMGHISSPCGEWAVRLQFTESNETVIRNWLNQREEDRQRCMNSVF